MRIELILSLASMGMTAASRPTDAQKYRPS